MPDAVTHCFLADTVTNQLQYSYLNDHFDLVQIGAQGPDPLFYHHYLPWKPNLGAKAIGTAMHTTSTKAYLEYLIQNAKDDETKAWVAGFITHFALDTVAHPYVFYRTGLFSSNNQENRGYHLRLERAIDNIYIYEYGYRPSTYDIKAKHFHRKHIPTSILTLLNQAGALFYDAPSLGWMYQQAYVDLRSAFRVLNYDPLGFKKLVFRGLDKITKGEILFSALSSYRCIQPGYDYKNTKKQVWYHPSTQEKFDLSFDELFQRAKDKATHLIQLAQGYYDKGDTAVFEAIENQSYDTGLACGTAPMVHFDIMFK